MQTKEWTLMFYFASDNPLASTIVSQLKAIKDAGYHPDANVIAHFDPHEPSAPVHVFDVNHVSKFWYPGRSEVGFASNDPFVRDLVMDRLWGEGNDDIRDRVVSHVKGDPEWIPGAKFDPPQPTKEMAEEQDPDKALKSFLEFCRESYPARHYMLFILGHGQVVGNDNLLLDEHAAKKALTLTDLGTILRTFNADVQNVREPGQVELIALHSCSMSAMEVAYELKGAANYMLASQGPTYAGNLPYKQILIRVFNDLNSRIAPDDINGSDEVKKSFVERFLRPAEPVSGFIRERLSPPTVEALQTFAAKPSADSKLLEDILDDVNKLLEREDTHDKLFKLVHSNGASNGFNNGGRRLVGGVNRRRLNRQLLADVFPELSRYPKHDVETMLSKIFYYCLYNSYDFQLAGYPFELCLTNLTKVSDTEDPINRLADNLIQALDDKNPIPKQLILLAHWDAQSFYQEDYVDLYDFCFCLRNRCNQISATLNGNPIQTLTNLASACDDIIRVLEKDSGKLVTLAAFAGAAFQYSHGHSIYFPWTRPTDHMWEKQYEDYRLNERTRWRDFLNAYFVKTMRKTRAEELGKEKGRPRVRQESTEPPDTDSTNLLALVGQIGMHVFAGDGSLSKPASDFSLGSRGPDDPFGEKCNCATIKNYPSYTSIVETADGKKVTTADGKEIRFNASEDFFAGQTTVNEPNGL